jgi:hypothetical protein
VTLASARQTSRAQARRLEAIGWPALALIGLLVLLARRPEAVLAAEFTWEEAMAFYVPTFFLDPVAQLTEKWGGTFQIVPRLGYLILRAVPVYWAPLAENLLALFALLAVASFIASRRMLPIVPDRRLRLVLAGMLLVMPAQREVMGALMNSQWYGGLWLILLLMASIPATAAGRCLERGLVALVALTGPFSTLLVPLYVWRLRRSRTRHDIWLTAIVVGGGAIQLMAILSTGRADVVETRPAELAVVTFLLHAAIVPMLGERLSTALGSAGIPGPILFVGGAAAITSLVVTAWRALPRASVPLLYGAAAIGASGLAVHGGANVWPPGAYERYFIAAGALVAAIVVGGLVQRQHLAVVLGMLLGAAILSDFRLEPYPAQGWDETYACIGSVDPCVLPIWPRDYDVHWPGIDGEYRIPDHVDP